MKKLAPIILLLLLVFGAKAQKNKVFSVNSAKDFVAAIGSDRTIELKGNTIYLHEITPQQSGENYTFSECYDGYELNITNVKNLKIVGLTKQPVKIITKPLYGNVLVFNGCDGITLENIDAGHGPQKGSCVGGVLYFKNSKNIQILNSIMFGSGIEGITTENVTNLTCKNSVIQGCTYSIMSLNDSQNFWFQNCKFFDNQEFDLINISNTPGVEFDACTFGSNRTGTESYSDYALFNIDQAAVVQLKNCTVENNLAAYLASSKSNIKLKRTTLENNQFVKGKFKSQ